MLLFLLISFLSPLSAAEPASVPEIVRNLKSASPSLQDSGVKDLRFLLSSGRMADDPAWVSSFLKHALEIEVNEAGDKSSAQTERVGDCRAVLRLVSLSPQRADHQAMVRSMLASLLEGSPRSAEQLALADYLGLFPWFLDEAQKAKVRRWVQAQDGQVPDGEAVLRIYLFAGRFGGQRPEEQIRVPDLVSAFGRTLERQDQVDSQEAIIEFLQRHPGGVEALLQVLKKSRSQALRHRILEALPSAVSFTDFPLKNVPDSVFQATLQRILETQAGDRQAAILTLFNWRFLVGKSWNQELLPLLERWSAEGSLDAKEISFMAGALDSGAKLGPGALRMLRSVAQGIATEDPGYPHALSVLGWRAEVPEEDRLMARRQMGVLFKARNADAVLLGMRVIRMSRAGLRSEQLPLAPEMTQQLFDVLQHGEVGALHHSVIDFLVGQSDEIDARLFSYFCGKGRFYSQALKKTGENRDRLHEACLIYSRIDEEAKRLGGALPLPGFEGYYLSLGQPGIPKWKRELLRALAARWAQRDWKGQIEDFDLALSLFPEELPSDSAEYWIQLPSVPANTEPRSRLLASLKRWGSSAAPLLPPLLSMASQTSEQSQVKADLVIALTRSVGLPLAWKIAHDAHQGAAYLELVGFASSGEKEASAPFEWSPRELAWLRERLEHWSLPEETWDDEVVPGLLLLVRFPPKGRWSEIYPPLRIIIQGEALETTKLPKDKAVNLSARVEVVIAVVHQLLLSPDALAPEQRAELEDWKSRLIKQLQGG